MVRFADQNSERYTSPTAWTPRERYAVAESEGWHEHWEQSYFKSIRDCAADAGVFCRCRWAVGGTRVREFPSYCQPSRNLCRAGARFNSSAFFPCSRSSNGVALTMGSKTSAHACWVFGTSVDLDDG